MNLSIIVPTYNNIKYLKFFLSSVKKNSYYHHDLVVHINDGSDGTLNYILNNKIKYTHSNKNIGLCSSMNKAFSLTTSDYILYAHDDMYFCKDWDKYLINEIKKQKNNLYYLSGINVSTKFGLINYDCGDNIESFNEDRFLKFCINDTTPDIQSSHWAPHLIHRELWNKIGGFSEEFNPGDGSDPDLCMKLWLNNVRIFKAISKFKVYHFNSLTSRKGKVKLNNGTKIFLLKYGINPRFFRKYFLRGNNSVIPFIENLSEPKKDINFYIDLVKCKLKLFFHKIFK